MKRPLFFVAVLLVLGIFLLNTRADTRRLLLFDRPAFAMDLESYGSGFRIGEFDGRVEWIFKKNGKTVLRVNGGKEYGTVYCYLKEGDLPEPSFIGSRVRFSGSFFLFEISQNPGQFDVREYYENIGIYLGFSIDEMRILKRAEFAPKRPFYTIYRNSMSVLSSNAQASDLGFFESLLTTYSGEENDDRDFLSANYLSQILSASGLLISAIGMLIFNALKRATKNHFIRAFFSVGLIAVYCIIIGTPISFLRALLIFSFRVYAPVFHRSFDLLSAAGLSLILMILERPTVCLIPGMVYYYGVLVSVGILYPLVKQIFRLRRGLFLSLTLMLSMQCAFLPIQLMSSYGVNLYQVLVSILLLPLKTVAVLSLLLGIFIGTVFRISGAVRFFFGFSHYLRSAVLFVASCMKWLPGS